MNCIILEDEPLALNIIQSYVDKVPFLQLQATFRYPLEALNYLRNHIIDLMFLDINMPDLTGIQLFKSLQTAPMTIFTTAYSQYAIESYDLNAVDYLLKPIEFDRFLKAVNKAHQHLENKNTSLLETPQNKSSDILFVKSGYKTYRLNLNDILYVEADGNYATYITLDRKIISTDRLGKLMQILPEDRFIRVHKSFLIAFAHIDILQKEFITIKDKRIPIGRAYRAAFFERIEHF